MSNKVRYFERQMHPDYFDVSCRVKSGKRNVDYVTFKEVLPMTDKMVNNLKMKIGRIDITEFKAPSNSLGYFWKLDYLGYSFCFVNGLGLAVFPTVLKGQIIEVSFDENRRPHDGLIEL